MGRYWRQVTALLVVLAAVPVVVLLGLPSWLLADEHPARNVLEGLSWVAGVAAVMLVIGPPLRRWISNRSRGPSTKRESGLNPLVGRVLYLADGRLPLVREVNLLQLRVKRAIDTHREDGQDLPPYAARDIDEDLEWAITTGGIVLLHGRAAVGKSRAGAEALRRLCPDHRMVVPVDGKALRELVESGYDLGDAVIWLDDLEQFLTPDGLDLGLLQRLCPRGSNGVAVVVATIRDNELAIYDAAAGRKDAATGIDRAAIDLLAQVQDRRRIAVGQHLSSAERDVAAEVGDKDPRIVRAVRADEGFAEYLAAGTAMLDRWATGDGPLFQVGQAVISAAVDCRRAGFHQPVPVSVLNELRHCYLQPGWRDRSDLPAVTDGITWASFPLLGASSCLQPRSSDTYLASDYLVDRAQSGASPLGKAHIPEATWHTLLEISAPKDAINIGVQAYHADVVDIAETAFAKAANAGHIGAMFTLGFLLAEQGRPDEAETWFRKAIDAGDTDALLNLGVLLAEQGRPDEAEIWFRKAVDAGDTNALNNLGVLLADRDQLYEAKAWYRKAIEAGHTDALNNLGVLLAEQGRPEGAEIWFRRAVDAGDTNALFNLGVLLAEKDELYAAEAWYRKAVEAGHTGALFNLCVLLTARGRPDKAETWFRKAIDAGDTNALLNLGVWLVEQGRPDEAETWFRKAIDVGNTEAMFHLGVLLVEQGWPDEAETWFGKASDVGNTEAMFQLGVLLVEQGRLKEAETWHRKAIEGGHTGALTHLGVLIVEQGRPGAMFNLGVLLANQYGP